MITVALKGGLGNQMFQYAAARRLALRHDAQVRLDLSWYAKGDRAVRRPYGLGHFALSDLVLCTNATDLPIKVAIRVQRSFPGLRLPYLYVEKGKGSSAEILQLPDGTTLVGYFQSERFFSDAGKAIREDYRFKDSAMQRRVEQVIEDYRRSNGPVVAVHVRRGDYLTVCPGESLQVPLARLNAAMECFPDATFMVFSDDTDWCRTHLRRERVFISPFSTAIEDLAAMAACDHNIIANSTFSWWGAWLNSSMGKIVMAPKNWYGEQSQEEPPRDLFPAGWLSY